MLENNKLTPLENQMNLNVFELTANTYSVLKRERKTFSPLTAVKLTSISTKPSAKQTSHSIKQSIKTRLRNCSQS